MPNTNKWTLAAEQLRLATADEQPPLKIRDVMRILGYQSESAAEYALYQMKELGLVRWVENGGKGLWYLAW